MNKKKSLKHNFLMNIILTVSSVLFPIITFPYVSRILLPEGIGKVSFAAALVSYFNMFAQLGIPTYGIRACSKVRDNREQLTKTAQELLLINFFVAIISYLALIFLIINVPKLRENKYLYVIIGQTILLSAIGAEWLFKAMEQYEYITTCSIGFKLITVIAVFIFIQEQDDYLIYAAITVFASSASSVLNFYNIRKYIDLKPIVNYNFKRHFKPIFVFFSMACATTVYTNIDTVMLGFMTSDIEVGYYKVAISVKVILVGVVTSLGVVLLPRASYYVEHKCYDKFREISSKALSYVILLSTPLVVYFIVFSEEVVHVLSGVEYDGAIVPMRIIMPTLFLIGITNILGIQILVPLGREQAVLKSVILGAIADLIMNAILISKMGATGAAIGTLVAEFVVLISQCFSLKYELKQIIPTIGYLRLILAVLLSSIASMSILLLQVDDFVTLIISSVVFFTIYIAILCICKEAIVLDLASQILKKSSHFFKIKKYENERD